MHCVEILGVKVSTIGMRPVVDTIGGWISSNERRSVCACDVHSLVRAQDDQQHRRALNSADLVLPDGVPLVWVGKLRGHGGMERVCGPDLLRAVCARSLETGWSHYFYGGAPGVANLLAGTLAQRFPGLKIVGMLTPPFRPLTARERQQTADIISTAAPDIVWIGLGCPKQEQWMLDNVGLYEGVVFIGIGAAFDFETGRVKRAPKWMQSHGLEWLYRLSSEPRRLGKRYLYSVPRFLWEVMLELSGKRRPGGAV
jgi:N-acetylglucosaminyldiphosphoundecaprenol N-acetyl-beta-D-mannosaminyltransferase